MSTTVRSLRERDFRPGGYEGAQGRVMRHVVMIDGVNVGEIEEIISVSDAGQRSGFPPGIEAITNDQYGSVATLGTFSSVEAAVKAIEQHAADLRDRSTSSSAVPAEHGSSRAFDYSVVPPELATKVRQLAGDVRGYHRRTVEEAGALGRRLIEIRTLLPSGHFAAWVDQELGGSRSGVYRFIGVAERLDQASLSQMGQLGLTVVYQLASFGTPPKARQEIVGRIKAGEQLDRREVSARIYDARQERDRKAAEEKKSAAQRSRERRTREQGEREHAKFLADLAAADQRRQAGLATAASIIVKALIGQGQQLAALKSALRAADEDRLAKAIDAVAEASAS